MSIIHSSFGTRGNFEVVMKEGSHLTHYWRNNDDPVLPWYKSVNFGDSIGSDPALIQGTFGNVGNFEVVVKEGDKLRHYWRNNDSPGLPWHKGAVFCDYITFKAAFIQGRFGNRGNFELISKRGACFVHFWRNNDSGSLPWSEEIQTHATVPLGNPPNQEQKTRFTNWFPRLRNFKISAPASYSYNCISWSVGVTDDWLWPGNTVADFDSFYAQYGWMTSLTGKREYKKRKVALWADEYGCTHGSPETYNCDWHESKCGSAERIMHDKFQMQGGGYGNIIKYYEKADQGANLDLV